MKKVVLKIVLTLLLLAFIGITTYSSIELIDLKSKNEKATKEISEIENNIKNIKEENDNYESQIPTLEENSKEKIEEQEIWKKAKDKLKEAL